MGYEGSGKGKGKGEECGNDDDYHYIPYYENDDFTYDYDDHLTYGDDDHLTYKESALLGVLSAVTAPTRSTTLAMPIQRAPATLAVKTLAPATLASAPPLTSVAPAPVAPVVQAPAAGTMRGELVTALEVEPSPVVVMKSVSNGNSAGVVASSDLTKDASIEAHDHANYSSGSFVSIISAALCLVAYLV